MTRNCETCITTPKTWIGWTVGGLDTANPMPRLSSPFLTAETESRSTAALSKVADYPLMKIA